jgi:hypothetical protein
MRMTIAVTSRAKPDRRHGDDRRERVLLFRLPDQRLLTSLRRADESTCVKNTGSGLDGLRSKRSGKPRKKSSPRPEPSLRSREPLARSGELLDVLAGKNPSSVEKTFDAPLTRSPGAFQFCLAFL